MWGKTLFAVRACAAGLLLTLGLAVAAQDSKEPPDPPGTTLYMAQLRALFTQWDTNSDGSLDKQELAVAFRGPGAKPYDYKKPEKSSKEDSDTKGPTEKKSDSEKDRPSTDTKKPDYSMYPDYLFLVQLDTDTDGMISKKEFLAWARDYAVQLKTRDDQLKVLAAIQTKALAQNQKLADLQAKYAAAKTVAAQKKVQAQIDKETKALNALTKQMAGVNTSIKSSKSYDAALTKALKK